MKWLFCLLLPALMSLVACDSKRATPEQCRAIFNRLVVLEMAEMGFDDPVLTQRRQIDFAYRYRENINSCVGRKIPPGALECVKSAKTAESVSHDCLR